MNLSSLLLIILVSAGEPSEELFKKGIYLFEHGDYRQAISILNRVVKENLYRDEKELVECYKYLGAAYFYIEDLKMADASFRQLLLIDPDFRLDPFLFPPSMVLFFDKIKKDAVKKDKFRESVAKGTSTLKDERYLLYINLLPFGLPQYAHEQRIKGSLLLFLQIVSLGANIYSYWKVNSMIDSYGYVKDQKSADEANIYKTIQIGSLSIFGATYLYSVIDGMIFTLSEEKEGRR
jgi:tetratricopeptide (TPR) repeat protein